MKLEKSLSALPIMSKHWNMVRILLATIALSMLASLALAQGGHSSVLTWTASSDAAANPTLTYNVYRVSGSCPAVAPTSVSGSGFTKINANPIATTTYTDASIEPGVYCYFSTAFLNGAESIPSNVAQVTLLPMPPVSFGVTSVK